MKGANNSISTYGDTRFQTVEVKDTDWGEKERKLPVAPFLADSPRLKNISITKFP